MTSEMAKLTHPQRVRFLYKLILRTHRALPAELRELGDKYVRDEFKRHKKCEPSYVGPFMMEWTVSFEFSMYFYVFQYVSLLCNNVLQVTCSLFIQRYVMDLNKQIRSAMKEDSKNEELDTLPPIGKVLGEEDLDKFTDYQLNQLLELAEEIHGKKPGDIKE